MSALVVNLYLFGGLCVLASWWKGSRRVHLAAMLALSCAAIGAGLFRQVLIPADLTRLPALADLELELFTLFAWAMFAATAASAGWRESSRFAPFAYGMLLGELGGAILAIREVSDPSVRARRVVAASAGALLGRVGDPGLWLLNGGQLSLGVCALVGCSAVVGLVVAAPPRVFDGAARRPMPVLAVGVGVWALSWVPSMQLPGVLLGSLALWWHHRQPLHTQPVARVIGLSVAVVVAVMAGLGEAWAEAVEARLVVYEAVVPAWIWAHGALSGLLLGSDGGGLMGRAVLDRALAVRDPLAPVAWGLGAAVAGMAPYLVTGTLWRALPRHLFWVVLSGALLAGALHLDILGS
ncbi:MAG: hypothetical protein CL927_04800 [Deltaproteobacteria bacterium]|nr:hypothetical protein [Deltaproteobacteria bacterium]